MQWAFSLVIADGHNLPHVYRYHLHLPTEHYCHSQLTFAYLPMMILTAVTEMLRCSTAHSNNHSHSLVSSKDPKFVGNDSEVIDGRVNCITLHNHSQHMRSTQAILFYCCPDCPSCLAHLNITGWAI